MYLSWTCDVPGPAFPLVLAAPGRRTAVVCRPFSPSRGAGLGVPCAVRGTPVPALAGRHRAGGLVRGGHAGCRCRVLAREHRPRSSRGAGGGSTITGKTWQPAGDGFAGHGPAGSRPARSPDLPRCWRGGPPAGFPGPGRDGQRTWQPVCPGSRTCRRSTPPANTGTNTGTCQQWYALSVADVLDTARINLPVDSQTDISVKLIKQSSVAGRRCVTYVNSCPPVRGPVSVHWHLLTPWSVPAGPCSPGPARS